MALLLAAVGLYGVIAYLVARRRRELAIRVALGAARARIVRLVLRQGAAPVGTGLLAGLLAAALLGRFIAALLYGVERFDGAALLVVLAVLVTTSFAAIVLPARRASRAAVTEALAEE